MSSTEYPKTEKYYKEAHRILGVNYDKLKVVNAELIKAVECSLALDYAHQGALKVLEKHGYDHSNRFELNATDFVHGLKVAALKKAKGQSCK